MRHGIVATAGVLVALFAAPGAATATRTVQGTVGEFDYQVLLPAGYDETDRRYPALYVIAGNSSSERAAAASLALPRYAAMGEAIIVTPVEKQRNNLITDWADGSRPLDREFVTRLIPRIDSEFRTVSDRSHRAIAGISAGGYSAMALAARHPDRFVAAGAFSGVVDITDRGAAGQATVELPQALFVDMQPGHLFRRFGNPYANPLSWHERNPKDLAGNLRGMALYAGAGNGAPADAQEAMSNGPTLPLQMVIEDQIRSMSESLVGELCSRRIPIDYRPHVGTHNQVHWKEDMVQWWPRALAAFGTSQPRSFDHRSAAPAFEVWDWSFRADPRRAPEFLDVTDASGEGITLTGSGTQEVRTAPLFKPRTRVGLSGATDPTAKADERGRISFRVQLGPPHAAEQYTPGAIGQTFVTRRVEFTPRGRR